MKDQIRKLRFIVQELELTLLMVTMAPDDFSKRSIARHILIRAMDFISHARLLRKPLRVAGHNVKVFNEQKETYAQSFGEYFQVSRDKISGHVQDIDFLERIEHWNQIEIGKIGYFVESAIQIYRDLEPLSIPDYEPWLSLPDFANGNLKSTLDSFAKSVTRDNSVRIGSDPLAFTRPGTVVALNFTPVHQRAGQLILINQWMAINVQWLDMLSDYPDCVRILKSRIVTDVVSFCDCLVTRKVTPGALQEMTGLNDLIQEGRSLPNTLDSFISNFKFEEATAEIRKLRNMFGGHLSTDATDSLEDIITSIDKLEFKDLTGFYYKLNGAFNSVCREVTYLLSYLSDGAKLGGVKVASAPLPLVPFDPNSPTVPAPPDLPPNWNDPVELSNHLEEWIAGTSDKYDARMFIYNAGLHSKELEVLCETQVLGSGRRFHNHKFRTSHQFLLDKLISETSKDRVEKILYLVMDCKNSDPYSYAEVVARYAQQVKRPVDDFCIVTVLGELASRFQGSAMTQLELYLNSKDSTLRLNSVIALHKILVRSEDLNNKQIDLSYDSEIEPHLSSFSREDKLLLTIIFASQFTRSLGVYAQKLDDHYQFLKQQIEDQIEVLTGAKAFALMAADIKNLLTVHDYTGIGLHLSYYFDQTHRPKVAKAFLLAAVNRAIEVREGTQSRMNYVACLIKNENYTEAIEAARHLAAANPSTIDIQLFEVEIIGSCPNKKEEALKSLEQITKTYNLDEENIKHVEALRKALTTKSNLKKKPKTKKPGKIPTRKRRL